MAAGNAAPVTPQKPLTRRQRNLVKELPLADNNTEAAIKAGFAPNSAAESASENLRRSNVVAAIEAQQAKVDDAAIATQIERKTWLSKVLRKVNLDEPQPVQAGLAASDQLNRMESLYITKSVNVDVNVALQAELTQTFSLDELRALLNATKS